MLIKILIDLERIPDSLEVDSSMILPSHTGSESIVEEGKF